MSVEASERVDASEYSPLAIPTTSPSRNGLVDESEGVDLSPELRADLLDLDAWGEILATYGRTMKVAVAFQGKLSQSFKTYFLLEFPLFLPIPHIIRRSSPRPP